MRAYRHNTQRGYALLLMLLVLMGAGGFALANFTQSARQEAEEQRYQHNQRVLREAKQALLMYAYNYPENFGATRGPGRLPCPDTADPTGAPPNLVYTGTPDNVPECLDGANGRVGRFPFAALGMDFYQALDASGELLWYAVSSEFAYIQNVTDIVNSNTNGTITLADQSGAILYDGAANGLAAVIIAPGPIVRRDEDGNGTYEFVQLRNTNVQRGDPRNYLDTFNGFDNRSFVNGSNAIADSFILGPIFDINEGETVVNDQIIVVTAEEVIAMAEKKVLETYRDALDRYRANVPGGAGYHGYPWLQGYDDIADLDLYDVPTGKTVGRVPFMNYFLDQDSPQDIVTDLQINFDVSLTYTSMEDLNDPFDTTYIDVFNDLFAGFPAGVQTVDITRARVSFEKKKFDGSADTSADDIGTMIVETAPAGTNVDSTPESTLKRYFWDGCPTCFEAADGWEACPVIGAPDGTDCALNAAGTAFEPYTDWSVHADVRIRMVELRVHIDPEFVIELDYNPAPGVTYDSAPTDIAHARFTTNFAATEVLDLSVVDVGETSARNFFDLEVVACDQDNEVFNDLNLVELGNANAGTVDCTVDPPTLDLSTVASHSFTVGSMFDITLDYHPELPFWVAINDWDNTVMMSYATEYRPSDPLAPTAGACTPEDGAPGSGAADDCLVVNNLGGVNNNVISVLVLSGENDLVDDAPLGNFIDDLDDIFEGENYSGMGPFGGLGLVFDRRETADNPTKVVDTVYVTDQM